MTPDLSIMLLRFGAACAGSIACALVLDWLLRRAALRWPALAAHRSVWLLAQATVALVFVLACAPLPRAAVAPTLALPPAALQPISAMPDDAAPAASPADTGAAPVTAIDPATQALRWLPAAWLAVYLAGFAWHAARRLQARRHWRRLLRHHAQPIDAAALLASPAFTPRQRRIVARSRLVVCGTELAVSPMLLGLARPRLLLPAHLSALDVAQQRLIVEHELTHWRRLDPLWLSVSGICTLLFWFNRPLRALDTSLRAAVELGCDDAVLAGRAAGERQGYAAALVAQLRLQLQGQACAAPAFGSLGVEDRILRMRAARPPRLSARGRLLVGAGALGFAALGAALQPAFSVAAVPPALAAIATAPEPWRYPLDQVRATMLYGVRSPSVPAGNHGVDFAAKRGTPVRAVAAGTVVEAAIHPAWGNYVRIDHGGGVSSLLIHLERASVAYGQRVAGGDVIGLSGASGRAATGPHLHLEYWRDGRRLDPQAMLADLSDRATPHALARRRAQGNPIPLDQ